MKWSIKITNRAGKRLKKLPEMAQAVAKILIQDLEDKGPVPGKHWPNYSKLKGQKGDDIRHCHLMKGRPTYVACWQVVSKKNRMIEVIYVGTHEQAPY